MPFPELPPPELAPELAAGPYPAFVYTTLGFRVVPISPETKSAARRGFGKGSPTFSTPPADFRASELVAIIMGPCPRGFAAGDRWLCGLDLDGCYTPKHAEKLLGDLPLTLSSKQGRHLYYWLTPEQRALGDLRQGNDVFRTKAATGGAIDLRSAAGGYFVEKGNWDKPMRPPADLPDAAHAALLQARRAATPGRPRRAFEPGDPAFWEKLVYAGNKLPELIAALVCVWPQPGAGGGHELALAIGGVMADAWATEADILDFCSAIFAGAGAPDESSTVLASIHARRSGSQTAVYGWPALRRILCEHSPAGAVDAALRQLGVTVAGLRPPQFKARAIAGVAGGK